LTTVEGYNLGTLCIIDMRPRAFAREEIDELSDLASVVMDQMELRLSARTALEKAGLMAREIDHRVMNSLQFVSSLLTMQSRLAARDAATQLVNAASRISAVAQVHRNFYSEPADKISCLGFLTRLCTELSRVLAEEITVSGEDANVPTTWIQPIGLIANELLTNGAKHGGGGLSVDFRARADGYALVVCDQGGGFPADYNAESSGGLGMKILKALVRQLGGELRMASNSSGRGACVTVAWRGLAESSAMQSIPDGYFAEATACDSIEVNVTT
jgi:two-component sensor histidine kinase